MGVVSAGEGVRDFDVFVRRAIDYLHRDLASLGLRSSPRDFASGGAAGVREKSYRSGFLGSEPIRGHDDSTGHCMSYHNRAEVSYSTAYTNNRLADTTNVLSTKPSRRPRTTADHD